MKFQLNSLVVDLDYRFKESFDLINYFGIAIDSSLYPYVSVSDSYSLLRCLVEVKLSDSFQSTLSPTLCRESKNCYKQEKTYSLVNPPEKRIQYTFDFENPDLFFPIHPGEMSNLSEIRMNFYIESPYMIRKFIGSIRFPALLHYVNKNDINIFHNGINIIPFGQYKLTESKKQFFDRAFNSSGKGYLSNLYTVATELHPDDAFNLYSSIFIPQPLSKCSQFIKIIFNNINLFDKKTEPRPMNHPDLTPEVLLENSSIRLQLFSNIEKIDKNLSIKGLNDHEIWSLKSKFSDVSPLSLLDIENNHYYLPEDIHTIRTHYTTFLVYPELIPLALACMDDSLIDNLSFVVSNHYFLPVESALSIFISSVPQFHHYNIHKFATDSLELLGKRHEIDISLFIPQLVKASRFSQFDISTIPIETIKRQKFLQGKDLNEIKTLRPIDDLLLYFSNIDHVIASEVFWEAKLEQIPRLTEELLKIGGEDLIDQLNLNERIKNFLEQPPSITVEEYKLLLQKRIAGQFKDLQSFKPTRLPLFPEKFVVGIDTNISVFQSKCKPTKLKFKVENSTEFIQVIFKYGDDMRQDQLAIQLFRIMDSKKFPDMLISAYQIRPFSSTFGCCEFLKGATELQDLEDKIWEKLSEPNPEIPQEKKEWNYFHSLATSSVMSYILAIGDRHLQNILLINDGKLAHIDYGFIFGDDPKPGAPVVKITEDMMKPLYMFIDKSSKPEGRFLELCCALFEEIRCKGKLILLSILLSGINQPPELQMACFKSKNPENQVASLDEIKKRVNLVENNLKLKLSTQEAKIEMRIQFSKAITDIWAKVLDAAHTIAITIKK